jgi:hypothetical protein
VAGSFAVGKKMTLVFKEDSGCYQTRSYGSVSSAWPWPLRALYNAGKEYYWVEVNAERKKITRIKPFLPEGRAVAVLEKTEIAVPEHEQDLTALELAVIYGPANRNTNAAI